MSKKTSNLFNLAEVHLVTLHWLMQLLSIDVCHPGGCWRVTEIGQERNASDDFLSCVDSQQI